MTLATAGRTSPGVVADDERVGSLRPTDRDDVLDLVAAAASLTGGAPSVTADRVRDHCGARRALESAWDRTLAAMTTDAGVTPEAVDLLRRIKTVDDALLRRDIENRNMLFHRVREGLASLADIQSTAALVTKVPSVVCALGFDRAIVSRVEDSVWIPEHVAIERDPTWAGQILEIGRGNPLPLTAALPESEILRRRVSLVVENVQQRESINKPIADASLSSSYAASPIIAGGEVVGFLHGDCYYQQRDLDETDRQVLATFAEGLGQALARTLVLDQVGSVRAGLDEIASRLGAPGLGSFTGAFGLPGSGPTPPRPAAPTGTEGPGFGRRQQGTVPVARAELTRRELEVLRHMAAGDTNARTARRLVISEGTVKSHVKHILRKLGAANRAEAVSLWWQMQGGGAAS
ncbi:LuxR C-terminal-related transcriptional regulator [Actinomycetospora corticicola]|uniref:DNA-binding CsgD family transcriptional regulator n=1 Tax=Actinomycetospora corticicola TaxID=663602 RepID=A0A7Y9J7V7_9PSEU|nr:LuxR C-terminal-related transcriptional regulator [Actinomycetospora corticicola]NYD38815.1 DNA-binding CsgD family transcriptional regulator [Actinomycetospora corticicola]